MSAITDTLDTLIALADAGLERQRRASGQIDCGAYIDAHAELDQALNTYDRSIEVATNAYAEAVRNGNYPAAVGFADAAADASQAATWVALLRTSVLRKIVRQATATAEAVAALEQLPLSDEANQ